MPDRVPLVKPPPPVTVPALATVGEGLLEIDFEHEPVALGVGGDAANVGVMAARLGVPVRLAGRVGADAPGRRLLAFWREQGVDVRWLRSDPDARTGLYAREALPDGGHRFHYWRTHSAGSRLEAADIDPFFFEQLGVVVVTGITLAVSDSSSNAARKAVALAREGGVRRACILNHRPALGGSIETLVELARSSDVVLASREDAEAVLGAAEPAAVAAALGEGPSELVVTDGERPAALIVDGQELRQAVPEMAVRDPVGAGDAFAGAYLAARLERRAPAESLRWGVAAAALSVERRGCAAGYPGREQVADLVGRLAPVESADVGSRATA